MINAPGVEAHLPESGHEGTRERHGPYITDPGHVVQFYEADAALIESASAYIRDGLTAGDTCLVVATPQHREGIEARLQDAGVDVAAARADGRYVAHDAAQTLS